MCVPAVTILDSYGEGNVVEVIVEGRMMESAGRRDKQPMSLLMLMPCDWLPYSDTE